MLIFLKYGWSLAEVINFDLIFSFLMNSWNSFVISEIIKKLLHFLKYIPEVEI